MGGIPILLGIVDTTPVFFFVFVHFETKHFNLFSNYCCETIQNRDHTAMFFLWPLACAVPASLHYSPEINTP